MPQLGRFDRFITDVLGNALASASVTIYREGATVNGNTSGTAPLTVPVRHRGKIAAGDTVFIEADPNTTYSVNSVTATTVVLSGFVGTLSLLNGNRIIPSNNLPTLYSDDQGGATTGNPLTTTGTGRAQCWMEFGGYDAVVSGGGADTTHFTGQVTPSETPGQVRYAEGFPGADGGAKIANAIADLPSTGGVVDARGLVGSQTVSATITIDRPCLLLVGQATLTGSVDPLLSVTSNGVTIRGMGHRASTLQNTTATANVLKLAAGVDQPTINNVLLDAGGKTKDEANRTQGNCVWAAGTSGSPVTGLSMSGCRLIDGNNGFLGEFTNHSDIHDNLFAFTHAALAQLSLRSGDFNTVHNNRFTDTGAAANAIYVLHAADDPSTANSIHGNTIKGVYANEGINLFGTRNAVHGNTIDMSSAPVGATGIAVVQPSGSDTASRTNFNTVVGNTVSVAGTPDQAILIKDNGSTGPYGSNDNVVADNTIVAAGVGISIQNNCLRNSVSANRISVTGGTTKDGIIVTGSAIVDTLIEGNSVSGATRHGIFCNTSTRNVVRGNHCSGSTTDGIRMTTATDSIVEGNYTRSNGGYGIVLATGGTSISLHDNHSSGDALGALNGLTQTITAVGQAITLRSSLVYLDADASYVLTSTPTIADGFDGQVIEITNVDTADTITLTDQGGLANSNLRLGAATRALGPRDSIRLRYSATVGDWIELWFSNVT